MSALTTANLLALDALRAAVAEALERKRRLGQYAVVWQDGKVVRINPDGSTSSPYSDDGKNGG